MELTLSVFSIKREFFFKGILKDIGNSEGAIPCFFDNRGSFQSASKIGSRGEDQARTYETRVHERACSGRIGQFEVRIIDKKSIGGYSNEEDS